MVSRIEPTCRASCLYGSKMPSGFPNSPSPCPFGLDSRRSDLRGRAPGPWQDALHSWTTPKPELRASSESGGARC